MQQLSGLDAAFLYLETPQMPMHVGALHVFELPPGYKGRFLTALRKHIASRLPILPVLRRRLWSMPLNMASPAWVDAEPDLRQHIVAAPVAKGTTLVGLEAAVSRLHPVLLLRDRPLWKFHVFEDLALSSDGLRRVALYTQLHHAAVDGQAAVALANAMLDLTPVPRDTRALAAKASHVERVYQIEMIEMLRGVLGAQAQKVAAIVRDLPATVGTLKRAASALTARGAAGARGKTASGNVALAPRTALNASVTEGRAFAVMTLPLADLKTLARAHGATLNDIVLMLCSTALRRYLARRKVLPRTSLVAAVPITLRPNADVAAGAAAGNQASMSLVSLGTHLTDPHERLAHIRRATTVMKSTMGELKSILPTDYPSLGIPWLIEAATALYGKAKVAERIPQIANLVISNVPGPPVPLYMAGAHMLSVYPASIVVHGLALNITVQSYDQSLDFGLMADAKAMPDVADLATAVAIAFDDLCALPLPEDAEAATHVGAVERASQAARQIGGAVGAATRSAAGKAVDGAVQTAVDLAMARLRKRRAAPGRGSRRRSG